MATPLLVDTDPGIDDALALLAAWNSPEVVVEVVTTVAGNVTVEQATTNVCRLLALRKPDPAPVVAIGAPDPLARQLVTATRYHGADGLGDLDDWPAVGRGELAAAVPLILDRARRQQRLLTIVALGPMTNLALALKADPAAMKFVGRVVAMGGAVDVPGNVTPTAEFNLHVDPEAAVRVLDSGLRLDLVPLDATRQAVVVRADSPGGDPLASDLLAREMRAYRPSGKPLFVSQGRVAGSGGYWISMDAARITASPFTITGSIGVIGGWAWNRRDRGEDDHEGWI